MKNVVGKRIDINRGHDCKNNSRREAWLRAIEKEGLPWSNISNLDGWQTGFDSYGIQSLPSFVLIRCSDGQIVARKPWGRASHIPVGEIEKLLGQ